jgi:HSP20 family protein
MNAIKPDRRHRLLAQLATLPAYQRCNEEAAWFPPVDILEDAEEYLFKIDLPAVKREDLRVVVERDTLVISGERPKPWEDSRKYLRVERPAGYFERRFALPDDASRVEIGSVFAGSVLEVHVRKANPVMQDPLAANTHARLELESTS